MKAYDRWLARINDTTTPWLETDVIYFRKAVGQSGIQDPTTRAELRGLFADHAYAQAYRITDAHSEKGRAYLLGKSLKQNGARRKGCRLGAFEIGVLKQLSHHYLVGLERDRNVEHFLPIYRAVAINGDYFDYIGATYDQVEILGRSVAGKAQKFAVPLHAVAVSP